MVKDGSTVVLFKNNHRNEVFLVFRSDIPIWNTTGGGVEKGETPREAAIREVSEETSFKVKIVRAVGEMVGREGNEHYVSYLFEGRVISGEYKPEFLGCRGKWFNVNKLPISIDSGSKLKIKYCLGATRKYFKKSISENRIRNNWYLFLLHPFAAFKYFVKSR